MPATLFQLDLALLRNRRQHTILPTPLLQTPARMKQMAPLPPHKRRKAHRRHRNHHPTHPHRPLEVPRLRPHHRRRKATKLK